MSRLLARRRRGEYDESKIVVIRQELKKLLWIMLVVEIVQDFFLRGIFAYSSKKWGAIATGKPPWLSEYGRTTRFVYIS